MSAISSYQGYSSLAGQSYSLELEEILTRLPEMFQRHGVNIDVLGHRQVTPLPGEEPHPEVVSQMAGQDNSGTLSTMRQGVDNLRNISMRINAAVFAQWARPVLPQTRPVEAALQRIVQGTAGHRMDPFMDLIIKFLRKDIKHPIRNLPIFDASIGFGMGVPTNPAFSEAIGTLGEVYSVGPRRASGTVVEDTPVIRRYLRYLNYLARQTGMHVVWMPTSFDTHPAIRAATVSVQMTNGQPRILGEPQRLRGLAVYLLGDYLRWAPLSRYEFLQQPGQVMLEDPNMSYVPILNAHLPSISAALLTLGAFSPCKIFYKDFRAQTSSRQADPSPSTSSTPDSEQIPF
jgi:hypothetical protein